MKINYTESNRKDLAKAVSEITGAEVRYLGAPSFSYQIDYFTVDREGYLLFDDMADTEEVENLIQELAEKGFVATPTEDEPEAPCDAVTMEPDKVNVTNMQKMLECKGDLIRKALGIESVEVKVTDDGVAFPWFGNVHGEATKTYVRFIEALCKMSREQTRVNTQPKSVVNERYTFRCFLLRLGFIGKEYKADRKLLLKNLEGCSAFKNGRKDEHAVSE